MENGVLHVLYGLLTAKCTKRFLGFGEAKGGVKFGLSEFGNEVESMCINEWFWNLDVHIRVASFITLGFVCGGVFGYILGLGRNLIGDKRWRL